MMESIFKKQMDVMEQKAKLEKVPSVSQRRNLIGYYNELMGSEVKKADISAICSEEVSYDFKKLLESGKVIQVSFTSCNSKGDFECRMEGYVVVLEQEELLKFCKVTQMRERTLLLGRQMDVCVIRILEDRIFVAPAGKTQAKLKNDTKDMINAEIAFLLHKGENPVVWCRVIKVTPERAQVDILDCGIIGFIRKSQWNKVFIRSLEGICIENELYQFEVIRQAPQKEGTRAKAWVLSRRNIAPSPWDGFNVNEVEPGSLLVVRCTEKAVGKSYWWGVTERFTGIEIMGDYTESLTFKSGIFVGISYTCKVLSVEKNERNEGYKIKVRPLKVVAEDFSKLEAMHRAKGYNS